MRRLIAFSAILAASPCVLAAAAPKGRYIVYVGTYTGAQSKGIYAWRFDASTGKLEPLGVAGETPNPSFLAIHPNRRFLYSVSEIANYNGQRSGAVSAFRIDAASGKLTLLNTVPSRGSGPCHLNVDHTGRMLAVANYNSGSVAAFPIKDDGSLGEAVGFDQHSGTGADPRRQRGPHAHSVNFSPDNRFMVAADLGLDELFVYKIDPAAAGISPNTPPFAKVAPGSGPRHFAFQPGGRHAYVINEMKSTVTAFNYDKARGVLTEIQTVSTLPEGFSGNNTTAEVQVHPSGKFLYGSNRGHDSIAVFSIGGDGKLASVEITPTKGKEPRNFGIDPTGNYLFAANQNSGNIVIFRIDQNTGKLTPTGEVMEAPRPVCVKFLPL